jgi:sulfur carrier protein
MSVLVNGEPVGLAGEPATLDQLLLLVAPQKPFAVALNCEFVPSSNFPQCELKDGDQIDIVHPSAGG